jgi:hypothetical protein
MKTKILLPLLALLVCACSSNGSKEIELKEKTVVTQDPSDGLYEAYTRGAELVSLVPETVELTWCDDDAHSGKKQLNLTAQVRLDKVPDTDKYNVAETNLLAYQIVFTDLNGQYCGFDGVFDEHDNQPLYLMPGITLTDTATEQAKMKELLKSEPGTIATITFVGVVDEPYLDAVTEHVACAMLCSMYPLYDKR